MSKMTIGADVSKDTLDVHRHSDGTHRQFLMDAAGFRLVLGWTGAGLSRASSLRQAGPITAPSSARWGGPGLLWPGE